MSNRSCVCLCPIQVMMRVEMLYGAAGVVGSLVSGHLFQIYSSSLGHGIILLFVSTLLHLLCLMHSIFLLQVSVSVCTEVYPVWMCFDLMICRLVVSGNICLKQCNWTLI